MRSAFSLWVAVSLAATACTSLNDPPVCDDPAGHCNDPDASSGSGVPLHQYRAADPRQRPTPGGGVDWPAVVVIAVDNYLEGPTGKVGDVWVAERVSADFPGCALDPMAGDRVCGIQLFSPTPIPSGTHMLEGDLTHVSGGTYEEFDCPTCGSQFPNNRTLPEIGMPNIQRIGSDAPPAPIPVSLQTFGANATNDSYVGILVQITDTVIVRSGPDSHGEYLIDTMMPTGAGVTMSPQIGPIVPQGQPTLAAGTVLCGLTGIGSYFYNPKILVRGPSDFVAMPMGASCP